jgi:hypothetical protein
MRQFQRAVAAAAMLGLGLSAPALAQQTPGPDGTNANGPITIFKNYVVETAPMVVTINGKHIDHLTMATYDDITTTVHPGQNTMVIAWNAPVQQIHVKVAYAPTRNNFKNIVEYNASVSTNKSLNNPGSKTLTFTIPG